MTQQNHAKQHSARKSEKAIFLLTTLQTSIVNDPAYVVLVYSHTKCNRCNNHLISYTQNYIMYIKSNTHSISEAQLLYGLQETEKVFVTFGYIEDAPWAQHTQTASVVNG